MQFPHGTDQVKKETTRFYAIKNARTQVNFVFRSRDLSHLTLSRLGDGRALDEFKCKSDYVFSSGICMIIIFFYMHAIYWPKGSCGLDSGTACLRPCSVDRVVEGF